MNKIKILCLLIITICLLILTIYIVSPHNRYDLDRDGQVNARDLGILQKYILDEMEGEKQ